MSIRTTDQVRSATTGGGREGPEASGRRRPRLARRTAALAVGAALVVVSGCASSDGGTEAASTTTTTAAAPTGIVVRNIGDEGEAVDGGKLVFGLEAETADGLNPITGQFAASGHFLASTIFDPLATLDEEGNAVPYLAEAITPNADFTEWTITLRDGVTFHDGTLLDAAAVADTLERHRVSFVTQDAVRPIAATAVVDPLTVKVTMTQPWAQFPFTLTTQVGYIPAPSMLADPEGAFHPVGTGPFVFDSWTIGEAFQASRNDNYWQAGKPHLASIEFRPIPDSQARAEGVLSGDLDMIHSITPRDILLLRGEDVKMLEVSTGEESAITLNTAAAPFNELVARQALAAATDVDRLLAETGRDIADPARGVFAPGQLGYREDSNFPPYDLERAKELVAEYEAKVGQPLSFVYEGADTIDDRDAQQLLQEMWQAAGMEVQLVAVSQSSQIINTVLGKYQATDWRNFGSPDPDGDYMWWHSTSVGGEGEISLNVPRLADPELDTYLDQARATTDAAVRDDLYAKASTRINEGLGYIWLERPVWALVSSPEVNGYLIAQNGSISTLGTKTWVADLWLTP